MKELLENISAFLEVKMELIKVELQEDLAELGSRLILLVAIVIFAFMALLTATVGISQYLNEILSSKYLGFIFITIFNLLLVVVLVFLNKYFKLGESLKRYILKILDKENG